MKNHLLQLFAFLLLSHFCIAQVSISATSSSAHPSALLDVKSTDKGLLIPRLTTIERNGIQSPEIGLMVFDKDLQEIFIFNSDGWKQATLSKLPLLISSNSTQSIVKITNTNFSNNALEITGNVALNGKIINEAYQYPVFQNNWTNYGSGWNDVKFYKGKEGRVYLEGVLAPGTDTKIFTLPVDYRPAKSIFFLVSVDNSLSGRIDINPNGDVILSNGIPNIVGLDGISFRVE